MNKYPDIKDCTFEIMPEWEEISVKGNALVSGDESLDKEAEEAIIKECESGNVWAWCTVFVKCSWEDFSGSDCLGCCSYENEKDFKTGGYYEDMKKQAYESLKLDIDACVAKAEKVKA